MLHDLVYLYLPFFAYEVEMIIATTSQSEFSGGDTLKACHVAHLDPGRGNMLLGTLAVDVC